MACSPSSRFRWFLGANVRPIEAQTAYSAPGRTAATPAIVIDAATGEVLFARQRRQPPLSSVPDQDDDAVSDVRSAVSGQGSMPNDVLTISPLCAASQSAIETGPWLLARPSPWTTPCAPPPCGPPTTWPWPIGEHIGGIGEPAFTSHDDGRRPQQLGMTQTRYYTANGPAGCTSETTSARDQAILARAIMRDFLLSTTVISALHDWAYNGPQLSQHQRPAADRARL